MGDKPTRLFPPGSVDEKRKNKMTANQNTQFGFPFPQTTAQVGGCSLKWNKGQNPDIQIPTGTDFDLVKLSPAGDINVVANLSDYCQGGNIPGILFQNVDVDILRGATFRLKKGSKSIIVVDGDRWQLFPGKKGIRVATTNGRGNFITVVIL